jgi:GcrA cell cycle regulator
MGKGRHTSCWPERDDELRKLWAEGLPTAAIGEAMGLSKNSLVGRAHRLGLPSRPSPIRRGDGVRYARPTTIAARETTLKNLAQVKAEPNERLAPEPPPAPTRKLKSEPCCFPIGTPRTPTFRYCDEPSEPGKPYCRAHCAEAYASYGAKPVDGHLARQAA